MGTFDFSDEKGLQSGLQYDGGTGFDLGEIDNTILEREKKVQVKVGGGFFSTGGINPDIKNIEENKKLESIKIYHNLFLDNTAELFHSFYLKSSNPLAYKDSLIHNSYIKIDLSCSADEIITTRLIYPNNTMQKSYFTIGNQEKLRKYFWRNEGFIFERKTKSFFTKSLFTYEYLKSNSPLFFEFQDQETKIFHQLKFIEALILEPAQILEYQNEESAYKVIEYQSETELNGLTKAFLVDKQKNFSFLVKFPKVKNFNASGSFNSLTLKLDYFKIDELGRKELVPISDYTGAWKDSHSKKILGETISWDPHKETKFIILIQTLFSLKPKKKK